MVARPAVNVSRPAVHWSSVDFPEPDGPMTAVSRPPGISRVTSSRARTAVGPVPYTLLASSRVAAATVVDVWILVTSPIVRIGGPRVVAQAGAIRAPALGVGRFAREGVAYSCGSRWRMRRPG